MRRQRWCFKARRQGIARDAIGAPHSMVVAREVGGRQGGDTSAKEQDPLI